MGARSAIRIWVLMGCAASWALGCGHPQLVAIPPDAPASILIHDVAVLDVVAGEVLPHRDVRIEGDRIAEIGPTGALASSAAAAISEIDGRGQTLLPGLIDSHGHVAANQNPAGEGLAIDVPTNLGRYLYCGVTTVLDPGTGLEDLVELERELSAGRLLGPRIYGAHRYITAPGGHPIPVIMAGVPWGLGWYVEGFVLPKLSHRVRSADEARAAVAIEAEERPAFVKLIVDRIPPGAPRIDRETIAAAAAEARRRGVRSVAHIGSAQDAFDAGDGGVDAWVHGVYKAPLEPGQAEQLAAYGIPMVPTLAVWEGYAIAGRAERSDTELEKQIVPAELLAAYDEPPGRETDVSRLFAPWLELMVKNQKDRVWGNNARLSHEAGITILAGSDAQSGVFPGAGLHRELHYLRDAGLDEVEVLRAATLYPARFLDQNEDPSFGVVAAGKRADLLLVGGNPLEDLSTLSDVRAVILGGVVLTRTPVGR